VRWNNWFGDKLRSVDKEQIQFMLWPSYGSHQINVAGQLYVAHSRRLSLDCPHQDSNIVSQSALSQLYGYNCDKLVTDQHYANKVFDDIIMCMNNQWYGKIIAVCDLWFYDNMDVCVPCVKYVEIGTIYATAEQ